MEDHYETLPATRETHYETLPVPRVTDDHIYLDLMNNGKPKRPISLKSIENTAVKDIQYKDKKTQSSVTTQALETVILPSSKASNGKTKINKRVLIGICVVVVCLVVGTTVGIFVSSSGSSQTDDQEGNNVPAVTISKSAYTVKPGGSVTLNCIVSSTTNIEKVYWQRTVNNDVTVIQTNKFKYSGSTPSIPSLTINNAGLRDAGKYQCFAENEAGTEQSGFTIVTVGNVPAVTISKSAYTVKPGGSVTLNCIASSSSNIEKVYWKRTVNNEVSVIQTNAVKYSGSTPSFPSLTINNAGLRDAGQYQCFAENAAGTGQSAFTIVTIDSLPTVTVLKSDYTVKAASSVTLNCIVSSSTNISTVFLKRTIDNNVTLIQTNKFKFSGSTPSFPSLTINNAGLRDAGQYQCFAENEAGTGQSVFTTLTVDKPCGLLKDGWKNFHGHYYIFITTVKTWKDAEEDCRYFSARLAEVQTRDEGQWLKNQARQKGGDWWLGASDEANEGQWRWTSGNTLEQHTNWAPKKPDNNYGQDCLQMLASANYLWNDQTCTNKINYICEKSSC
ncbi:aggrecan core protein-like isoform X1 [Mytilus edulis]|uniref:aggrecan core protein-like isoform X1 n=1 Tax=Mytilus edulis TaxID=6550 RepID=UPI0039F0D43C